MTAIISSRSADMRKATLWVSIVLTVALSLWCLVVPYWHIHDPANPNRVVRSERRAIWKQENSAASLDVIFTLVPAAAFAIIAAVLGFSLRDSAGTAPPASSAEDEPVLKR